METIPEPAEYYVSNCK